jgi:hypothetical protein
MMLYLGYTVLVAGEWKCVCRDWQTGDRGKPEHSEKDLSQCHFVHHKPQTNCLGIELGFVRWATGNKVPNWGMAKRYHSIYRRLSQITHTHTHIFQESDGVGVESWWGRYFPHPSSPDLGPTQPPIQWVLGLFPRVKRLGRGVDHTPHLELKKEYSYTSNSPSGPSRPVLGWTLPLFCIFILPGIKEKNRQWTWLYDTYLRYLSDDKYKC